MGSGLAAKGTYRNRISPNLVMAPALGAGIIQVQILLSGLASFPTGTLTKYQSNPYNTKVFNHNNVSDRKIQERC